MSSPIGKRFGQQADRYDAVSSVQRELALKLWESMRPHVPMGCQRILDIGAGTGHLTQLLAQSIPNELHILDLSSAMLEAAQRLLHTTHPLQQLHLHCENVETWQPSQQPFQVIASSAALQWFENVPKFLAHTANWLAPQGILGLATFGPQTLHELHLAYAAATGVPLEPGTHMISEDVLQATLRNQGFHILTSHHCLATMDHEKPRQMLRDLKSMGVTGNQRQQHLTRQSLQRLQALLPSISTWELVWTVAQR